MVTTIVGSLIIAGILIYTATRTHKKAEYLMTLVLVCCACSFFNHAVDYYKSWMLRERVTALEQAGIEQIPIEVDR
jgi:hypothetical protein